MSLKSKAELEIDKKLEELMQQGLNEPATKKVDARKLAIALEQHAMSAPYLGPPTSGGGPMFCGWPIVELAKLAPTSLQAEVLHAIVAKNSRGIIPAAMPPGGYAAMPLGRPHSLEEMLSMRMRWRSIESQNTFAHVGVYERNETVHIWIVTKDNASINLQDEAALYPSDALVTKLRML